MLHDPGSPPKLARGRVKPVISCTRAQRTDICASTVSASEAWWANGPRSSAARPRYPEEDTPREVNRLQDLGMLLFNSLFPLLTGLSRLLVHCRSISRYTIVLHPARIW